MIHKEFNEELEKLLSQFNYKNVITFGSSKGGYGALLYGLINSRVNTIFTLVPQINAVDYIDSHYSKWKKLFFPKEDLVLENKVNNVLYSEELYTTREKDLKNKNLYLYTGIGDEQYKNQMAFHDFLEGKLRNNNIIVNSSDENHGEIVVDNQDFIYAMLKALYRRERVKSNRLRFIRKGLFILNRK